MNAKLNMAALLCAGAICAATAPASAATLVYKVSDFSGGSHGLWTNKLNRGAERFYSFQNDVVLTINTDTGAATLVGTAINPNNVAATLDLTFNSFLETTDGSPFAYKKERGINYDPANDTPDIDFFTGGSGTIMINGTTHTLAADPFASNTVFQYGLGANAKNTTDFGGSAWLNVQGQSSHWDLNFALSAVPEPATWMMMILGFGAIGGAMRTGARKGKLSVTYA